MNAARISAWASVLLAAVCAIAGWVVIGQVEEGASGSATEAAAALKTVEDSIEGSEVVVFATADAVAGAADSVEAAAATSGSTSRVAGDIADVAATLPPALTALTQALEQVDTTVVAIDSFLDDLPFVTGFDSSELDLDPLVAEIDPLVRDLRESERSLDDLATQTSTLEAETLKLAGDLRVLEADLRASGDDVAQLSRDVRSARTSLDELVGEDEVDLTLLRVLLTALALSVALAALPNLMPTDRSAGASSDTFASTQA